MAERYCWGVVTPVAYLFEDQVHTLRKILQESMPYGELEHVVCASCHSLGINVRHGLSVETAYDLKEAALHVCRVEIGVD